MNGYLFTLTCPRDGAELAHRNGAGGGTEAVAVARCRECGGEYVVSVHLRPMPGSERDRMRQRAWRARQAVGA